MRDKKQRKTIALLSGTAADIATEDTIGLDELDMMDTAEFKALIALDSELFAELRSPGPSLGTAKSRHELTGNRKQNNRNE